VTFAFAPNLNTSPGMGPGWLQTVRMSNVSQDSLHISSGVTADVVSDAELISRFAAADETAFSELYDRYSGVAYGVALRVSGSPERAEEVVQDAFMKLWRNPTGFDPSRAALSTYLLTLVRNASIDMLRRSRPTMPLEDEEGELLPIASLEAGPLERAELSQLAVRVRGAMTELSVAHQRTVELAYFKGSSREEIALEMNVPVGTVKSRLKYALDKLRGVLGEFDLTGAGLNGGPS
jgi:RNA polymerase sigma-70 factor, ECF subfamily